MVRPGPFQQMFDLAIGEEMLIAPASNETVEASLKRIKLRAAKYKPSGRSFRAKIDQEGVLVQRTPLGKNTKLADFMLMKAGDRLVLKSSPLPADLKKAAALQNYLNTTRTDRAKAHADNSEGALKSARTFGTWILGLDIRGRLVADCWADESGSAIDKPLFDLAVPSHPWAGEWP